MTRFVVQLGTFAISVFAGTAALAQNVIPADMQGQPLVYVKEGKINGCGVRFIIVDAPATLTDRSILSTYDVSFNLYLPGYAVIKGGSSDATWAQLKSSNVSKVEKPIAPSSLWLKAEGVSATQPLQPMVNGDERGFVLYQSALDPVIELFLASGRNENILVGTMRPGAKTERIFSGAITMQANERKRVVNCVIELLADIKK